MGFIKLIQGHWRFLLEKIHRFQIFFNLCEIINNLILWNRGSNKIQKDRRKWFKCHYGKNISILKFIHFVRQEAYFRVKKQNKTEERIRIEFKQQGHPSKPKNHNHRCRRQQYSVTTSSFFDHNFVLW